MRPAARQATCDQRRHCCNAFRYGQCNTHVRCSGGVACRVVSCVPPYRWDSCANVTLFDNATAEQSAPCLQGCGAILRRYDELGANGSYLGASLGPERAVGDGVGRHVDYRGGSIYWTSRTGARAIHGAARSAWLRSGGPRGPLGYPTAERVTRPDSSWEQRFQHGRRVRQPPDQDQRGARHGLPEVGGARRGPGPAGLPPAGQHGTAGTGAGGGRCSSAARSGRGRASRPSR